MAHMEMNLIRTSALQGDNIPLFLEEAEAFQIPVIATFGLKRFQLEKNQFGSGFPELLKAWEKFLKETKGPNVMARCISDPEDFETKDPQGSHSFLRDIIFSIFKEMIKRSKASRYHKPIAIPFFTNTFQESNLVFYDQLDFDFWIYNIGGLDTGTFVQSYQSRKSKKPAYIQFARSAIQPIGYSDIIKSEQIQAEQLQDFLNQSISATLDVQGFIFDEWSDQWWRQGQVCDYTSSYLHDPYCYDLSPVEDAPSSISFVQFNGFFAQYGSFFRQCLRPREVTKTWVKFWSNSSTDLISQVECDSLFDRFFGITFFSSFLSLGFIVMLFSLSGVLSCILRTCWDTPKKCKLMIAIYLNRLYQILNRTVNFPSLPQPSERLPVCNN